tara:strand:+ start:1278 stop:1655 length:378 start_codon:yes stop_codon:yes gene_type:complete
VGKEQHIVKGIMMATVVEIQRHLDLTELAHKYSDWGEVPMKDRMELYLMYAEETQEFFEALNYISEQKFIKAIKEFSESPKKIMTEIEFALDVYFYEEFADALQEKRVKLGYYVHDEDINAYVER